MKEDNPYRKNKEKFKKLEISKWRLKPSGN
jgi:hypothetical protein